MDLLLPLIFGFSMLSMVFSFLVLWAVVEIEDNIRDDIGRLERSLYGDRKYNDKSEFEKIKDILLKEKSKKK